jgi:gluconolactonase
MKNFAIVALSLLSLGFTVKVDAQQRNFPQSSGVKDVTTTEISGVVAANMKWQLAWQDPTENADGLVGTPDGGIIFGQEQGNKIGKVDKDDHYSVLVKDTNGTGGAAIDAKGRIIGVERSCFDPGAHADECTVPGTLTEFLPERKVLADKFGELEIGRINDAVGDNKGGLYFVTEGALPNNPTHRPAATANKVFYLSPSGKVSLISGNVRPNGIIVSPEDKTLYVTNGNAVVALDIQKDGSATNQRDIAQLHDNGNGDGMTVDSSGNFYVSTGAVGIQVFAPDGKYLGTIPTPRAVASICFSGPNKKILYAQGRGSLGPDGNEYKTPEGVRNNSKSIYKIQMMAQGYMGRPK